MDTQQQKYERGVYCLDDIPKHLRKHFKPAQASWDFFGVAWQLKRVLKPGGVIVWVVADATVDGSETLTSMKQAIHFREVCGLNVHDTMIFKKAGSGPNIHHPRYGHCWEFMFVLTKGTPATFNPHKTRKNATAGKYDPPQTKTQRNGELKAYAGNRTRPEYSIECNIWEYVVGLWNGDKGVENHPAYFPERLAADHILSWSNPGDVVLDPFAGSGTTLKMAKEHGRRWIGIEVNPAYIEICWKRVAQGVLPLVPNAHPHGRAPARTVQGVVGSLDSE